MLKQIIEEIAKIHDVYKWRATIMIEAELNLTPGKLVALRQYENTFSNLRIRNPKYYNEYQLTLRKVEGYLNNLKQEIKRKRSQ